MPVAIDVEDFFQFSARGGEARDTTLVGVELTRAMRALDPGALVLVRHDPATGSLVPLTVPGCVGAATAMPADATADRGAGARIAVRLRPRARALVGRLPDEMRVPLVQALRSQVAALRAAAVLPGAALHTVRAARSARAAARVAPGAAEPVVAQDRAGETILLPGTPWLRGDRAAVIADARRRGATFALLISDVAPLCRPDWCEPAMRVALEAWLRRMLPLTDHLLTFSDAAGEEVARHAAERGIAFHAARATVPMPSGFARVARPLGWPPPDAPPRPAPSGAWCLASVPLEARLMAGTAEARRPHEALLRVWRGLVDDLAPGSAPTLVFAGHAGWIAASVRERLRDDPRLAAHVALLADPSDTELAALAGGCLFAVFPWAHEGWGDPVAESLSLGCPCVVSAAGVSATAGDAHDLARRIDLTDEDGALGVLQAAVADGRAGAWRARVAAAARPAGWNETAVAVLRALDDGGIVR